MQPGEFWRYYLQETLFPGAHPPWKCEPPAHAWQGLRRWSQRSRQGEGRTHDREEAVTLLPPNNRRKGAAALAGVLGMRMAACRQGQGPCRLRR